MIYICPVCKKQLFSDGKRYYCADGHSFDISRKGYVNFLLSSSSSHGDNKDMITARRRFFENGYYDEIVNKLCTLISDYSKGGVLIDCGCGEGYYTGRIAASLSNCNVFGFDISSHAVSLAAGKYKNARFFVASASEVPLCDECADIVTNIFSPLYISEVYRILKPGGIFVYAVPMENHLLGLKEVVYDKAYKNTVSDTSYCGFECVGRHGVSYNIALDGSVASDLFMMTPYYYNCPRGSFEKIKSCKTIETEVGFDYIVYKKHQVG